MSQSKLGCSAAFHEAEHGGKAYHQADYVSHGSMEDYVVVSRLPERL
jgi:hypothetical protein